MTCMRRCCSRLVLGGVVWMVGSTGVGAAEREVRAGVPTFSEDVAPILYENCVSCHRAGEVAPMSLVSYEETRPWSRSIKNKVLAGEMPPWHADPAIGTFVNDRSLSEAEKTTIIEWVDGGAPEGDPDKLPAAPVFADGWQIGTPDVVLEMPVSFAVPAQGEIAYQYFTTPTNFAEDTWVQALEVRPGTRSVVHHILAYARDPSGRRQPSGFRPIPLEAAAESAAARARAQGAERGRRGDARRGPRRNPGTLIGTMAPGTNPMVFEHGTALRIPKGSELVFQVHYTANGTASTDRSRVGMVLAKEPPEREMWVGQFMNGVFEIPPGASNQQVDAMIEFTEETEIFALFPHTHLRGKRWEYRLRYPDGRMEDVLSVPEYDFNWQTYYIFEQPLLVPKGARILASAWYDNSAANRANPDPTSAVRWGDQTWEEMQYSGLTYSVPAGTPNASLP